MRAAHRRGDRAHNKEGQIVKAVGGSPTVFINGKPVMRAGDIYDDGSLLTQGSATVFINNQPAARVGDIIGRSGAAANGSPNVFMGDYTSVHHNKCQQAYQKAMAETEAILAEKQPHIYSEVPYNTNRERNMMNRYIHSNRLINVAYSKLYRDMPENRWAGLAAIVSSRIGCNMNLLAHKFTDDTLGFIVPSAQYLFIPAWFEALGEGNRAIFKALHPALRMAADHGYDQFLRCYKMGAFGDKVSKKIAAAVAAMRDGDIRQAADYLIDHEQNDIAPPIYKKYKAAFGSMKDASDILRTVGIDLQSMSLTRDCRLNINTVPFTKDLTNADDRIAYFWALYHRWNGVLD